MQPDFKISVVYRHKRNGDSAWQWSVTEHANLVARGEVWAMLPFSRQVARRRAHRIAKLLASSVFEDVVFQPQGITALEQRTAAMEAALGLD